MPNIGVVVLTSNPTDEQLFHALKAQAVTASSDSLFLIGPGEEEEFEEDDLRKGRGLGRGKGRGPISPRPRWK